MAIRNPRELGVRRPSRAKVGTDFEDFDGMDLESNPGSIARNAFRHLENIDFRGGANVRGGSEALNVDTLEGCHQFLYDYQPTPNRLYMTFVGLTGISSSGRSVCWFDPDFSGSVQRMMHVPWAVSSSILATFDGSLYLGVDGFVKKLHLIQPISGQDPLEGSGLTQDTVVASLLGYAVRAMVEYDAKLFIAVENLADSTNSAIYTWDGKTLTLDVTGIEPPTYMYPFRDKLIVGYASDLLQERDLTGGYVDITHTGVIATEDMVSHGDVLYIADGDANIWTYDGTDLEIWHTITGAEIHSLASFGGFLYYAYTSSTPHGVIGRWLEAAVFEDAYNDLTAVDPSTVEATILRAYRNKLYAVSSQTNVTSMLVF